MSSALMMSSVETELSKIDLMKVEIIDLKAGLTRERVGGIQTVAKG